MKITCTHCDWSADVPDEMHMEATQCKRCGSMLTENNQAISAKQIELMSINGKNERKIDFTGTGFPAIGWSLLYVLLSLLVIPAAWGAVLFFRWFVRNISFSDGAKATFEGKAGQVWGYFAINILLGFLPQFSRLVEYPALQQNLWVDFRK